jgi:siroheme synthase
MPGRNYAELAARLIASGLADTKPCASVSRGTTPQQQTRRTTISNLCTTPLLPSPALLVVGEVVRFAAADFSPNFAVETFTGLDAFHSSESEGPTA